VVEFFEQFLENFLLVIENAEETSIYYPQTYYHIQDYKRISLQSNEEPCMKFLLIIILQEPKEFGVTTSHMLLVVVATNVHTIIHFLLTTTGPHPNPQN
jgi:hypothetical protein